jgi:hypothetical protein
MRWLKERVLLANVATGAEAQRANHASSKVRHLRSERVERLIHHAMEH